jgi:hypothetical protein
MLATDNCRGLVKRAATTIGYMYLDIYCALEDKSAWGIDCTVKGSPCCTCMSFILDCFRKFPVQLH